MGILIATTLVPAVTSAVLLVMSFGLAVDWNAWHGKVSSGYHERGCGAKS